MLPGQHPLPIHWNSTTDGTARILERSTPYIESRMLRFSPLINSDHSNSYTTQDGIYYKKGKKSHFFGKYLAIRSKHP